MKITTHNIDGRGLYTPRLNLGYIVIGGIIPDEDVPKWKEMGVVRIFGPGSLLGDIVWLVSVTNVVRERLPIRGTP